MFRYRDACRVLASLTCVVVAVFLTGAMSARAAVNSWSSTGPDGGWVYGVAWHPTRNGVLFASVGRIYRSTDSGAHWTSVSPQTSIFGQFVFHPSDPDRILMSGSPPLQSRDGGKTFTSANTLPGGYALQQLAMASTGVLYAAAAGRVFRSNDFSGTWEEMSTGLPGGASQSAGLVISPTDPDTLYASFGDAGLFKTTNGGTSWTVVGSLTGIIGDIAINPNNASQLLVYKIDGGPNLWRSDDAGASWSPVLAAYLSWFGFDPTVAGRALAIDYANRKMLLSTDAGVTWAPAANMPALDARTVSFSRTTAGAVAMGSNQGVFYSTTGGLTFTYRSSGIRSVDPAAIAGSRAAPFEVFASFYSGPAGVHRRVPDGWQPTNNAQLMAAFPAPTQIFGLAVDPNDASVVYATGVGGVARSADAGATWTALSPTLNVAEVKAIAIDPANTQVLYLASMGEGILRSSNGGASWTPRNNGLPAAIFGVAMRHVAIDPADSQRLYAVNEFGVLYRTADAGLNWTKASGALPVNESVLALALDPFDSNRVYMGTGAALYRSPDKGITWTTVALPVNTSGIRSVLVDPEVPGTIALVVESPAGVIRSVDGGVSWERLPWDSQDDWIAVAFGALDPGEPGNLIVGGLRHGMREFLIAPDLSISVSGIAAKIPLGGAPSLRVVVQNKVSSSFATANATVSLVLPPALAAGTISSTRGSCARNGQSVTCQLGALKVGETAQIDLPLTVAGGAGSIAATVEAHEFDPFASDNALTLPVIVEPFADLRTTVTAPAAVDHGSTALVDVQVMNLGPHAAAGAGLILGLPTGFGPSSAFSNPLCKHTTGTTVICELGALLKDASVTIQVPVAATTIGVHPFVATATSTSHDPDSANSVVNRSVTVKPVTDLAVALGDVPASMATGQKGTITATVTNNGPDPLNVVVATLSGTGLSITDASPIGGSCSIAGGTVSCSLGALAAGASRIIDLAFTVTAASSAQVNASTDSEGVDGTLGNNSASRAVTIAVPTPSTNIGGSGGGALGLWGLLALLGWACARLWRAADAASIGIQ
jgi:photosystem II stability/assembly factor-like uncharacterized protein